MSEIQSQIPTDIKDTTKYKWFAFVCDGEVAYIQVLDVQDEHKVAVFSSNPTIIPIKPDDAAMGDLYTDGAFTKLS